VAAGRIRRTLRPRLETFEGAVVAGVAFLAIVAVALPRTRDAGRVPG
jgi:hypothetical protein